MRPVGNRRFVRVLWPIEGSTQDVGLGRHLADRDQRPLVALVPQLAEPLVHGGEKRCLFRVRQRPTHQLYLIGLSNSLQRNELAPLGLQYSPISVGSAELSKGIEVIGRISAKIDAHRSVGTEPHDDVLTFFRTGGSELNAFHQGGRFTEQVFPIRFFSSHAA